MRGSVWSRDRILDVRRLDEWQCGHFEDAVHVPLADLSSCLDDLPAGTIWVHCAAGYRAGIAASLLARLPGAACRAR